MPSTDPQRTAHPLTDRALVQLREAQLRGILASAGDGIVTIDATQTIVMANPAAAAMFRCSVDDLVGAPLARLIPPRLRERHAALAAAFAAGEPDPRRMGVPTQIVGLRADGQEFPLEASISLAHIDDVRLATVILRDLSELRRTEAALQACETLLAATFGASSIGIALVDVHTRRFVMVNAACCALCGHSAEALSGLEPAALCHPQTPLDPAAFEALLAGRSGYQAEHRLARPDGEERWIEVEASLIRDRDGQPLRLLGLLRDITARRAAEQSLRVRAARQSFLVQLNDHLRDLQDPQAIAREATGLLGRFAGVARVAFAEDDGNGQTCTITCGHAAGLAPIDGCFPLQHYGATMLAEMREGRTVVMDDIASAPLLAEADRQRRLALGIRAAVNVPLHGATRRAVLFVQDAAPRHWTADEIALCEEVAQRLRADIDRARAAAEARATRETLQAALGAMSDTVYITDAQGNCVARNAAFDSFHRVRQPADSPRELDRWGDVLELVQPDGTPVPIEHWPAVRALHGETASNVELLVHRRDTGEHWVGSYSFAPIRDAAGAIDGCVIVGRDITALKRMHDELEAAHGDLQRLLAEQDRVQEQERVRIARELHDDLLQSLAAILLEATRMRGRAGRRDVRVDQDLARIEGQAAHAIQSARRMVHDLRPQALEELGLAAALADLGARFSERSGVPCEVDTAGLDAATATRLTPLAGALYRIAQEALANIDRHAGAQRAQVVLDLVGPLPTPATAEQAQVRLRVRDDGVGMPARAERRPDAFGLLGMRERVHAAGGTLDIRSSPGAGTLLTVKLPLPATEGAAPDDDA